VVDPSQSRISRASTKIGTHPVTRAPDFEASGKEIEQGDVRKRGR
jgi:hypothetical protein